MHCKGWNNSRANYVVSDRRRQTGLETATGAYLFLALQARDDVTIGL